MDSVEGSVDEIEQDDENFYAEITGENPRHFFQPELINMVHHNHRHYQQQQRRPEILEHWTYNWQTKEMKMPDAMVLAGKTISNIEDAFEHLKYFHQLVKPLSEDFKTDELFAIQDQVEKCLKSHDNVIRQLETRVNAVRLYWFPENVEHMELGAYKSVRHPPEERKVSNSTLQSLICSVCQESYNGNGKIPVIFKRRCTLIPLLRRCCDLPPCVCTNPPLCLHCALNHILKNGIHEGKSSVKCPNCRGELCIYDIQEVLLVKHDDCSLEEVRRERDILEKLRQTLEAEKEALLRDREMILREREALYRQQARK